MWIATSNPGKLREIAELGHEFSGVGSFPHRSPPLAEETGETFLANAQLKAQALFDDLKATERTPFAVLADDSGLEVDALDGAPGVRSARYAGDHVEAHLHMEKLLAELATRQVPAEKRTARYRCALVLIFDDGSGPREFHGEGACEGIIAAEGSGSAGFGYDPVFIDPDTRKSYGELTAEHKNRISHRRRAFEALVANLAQT